MLTITSSNTNGASLTYTYDVLNRLSTVTDNRLLAQGATSGVTTYNYDAVGDLQSFTYPNGVTHAYTYDALNRLTQIASSKNAAAISSYHYILGPVGNRTSVAELSGRAVAYAYDSLYRLTSETVTSDPAGKNGAIGYTYDAVGNRLTLNSTLTPAGGTNYTYDVDDRLAADQYDPDGNTTNSGGIANAYDFENHLITHGGVAVVYDGDGNRVSETVAGVTTNYLVDTQNLTGYAQVVDELVSGTVTRTYAYGLERISENQTISSTWTPSFYGYDGHGSVRQLTNSAGSVTDGYDYDTFGNLTNSTGNTPNNYLFAGEQYDPALGLYYNRARYLNTATGRFWSMDSAGGDDATPFSIHKYLYVQDSPIDNVDPSGNQMIEVQTGQLDGQVVEGAATQEAETGVKVLEGYTETIGSAAGGPYPIAAPAVVSSPLAKAAIWLTVVSITASFVETGFTSASSEDQLTKPGYNDGFESTVAFRDADGPSGSDFRIDPSRVTTSGFEVSLLEGPRQNKRYTVPFHITYRALKRVGAIGAIMDSALISQFGEIPAIFSPPPDGHWSMEAPADVDQQKQFKNALAAYGKNNKIPTGN